MGRRSDVQREFTVPALLRNGVIGAPGGARKNSGPTPNRIKREIGETIWAKKLIHRLGQIGAGEPIEQVVNENGETVSIPAPVRDQVSAIKALVDKFVGNGVQILNQIGEIKDGGQALKVLQILQEISRNGNQSRLGSASIAFSVVDGRSAPQITDATAQRV